MTLPENQICADCQKKAAKWASATLGVFICIDCSGIHRDLGAHISFVRSCTLDSWTPEQARLMRRVGNAKANAYYEANLPPEFMRPMNGDRAGMQRFIYAKYVEKRWAAAGDPPQVPRQTARGAVRRLPPSQSIEPLRPVASLEDMAPPPIQQAPAPAIEHPPVGIKPEPQPQKPPQQNQPPKQKPVLPHMNAKPAPVVEVLDHSPMPEPKRPVISIQSHHTSQHLFNAKKGKSRFAKKSNGQDVLDGMMAGPRFGAVSAPVQQINPQQMIGLGNGSSDDLSSFENFLKGNDSHPPEPEMVPSQTAENPFAQPQMGYQQMNQANPFMQPQMTIQPSMGSQFQQPVQQETVQQQQPSMNLFDGLTINEH